MKHATKCSFLIAATIGAFVTLYWILAFYSALTTPLNFGFEPPPSDPWAFIAPIRDSGFYAGTPLVLGDSHPLRAIPIYDHASVEMQLATLAFCFGLGAMLVSFFIIRIAWWLKCRRTGNRKCEQVADGDAEPAV